MAVQILTCMFTGDTAVHEACKTNNLAIADFVFSNSKNLNNLNSRWSSKQNMSGDKLIICYMLRGDQGIHVAAVNGNTNVLGTLLSWTNSLTW